MIRPLLGGEKKVFDQSVAFNYTLPMSPGINGSTPVPIKMHIPGPCFLRSSSGGSEISNFYWESVGLRATL